MTQTNWYSQKRVSMKKKLLHIEEYTHGGEDTQSNVHAGEVYTRRNWRELHTEGSTRGERGINIV